MVPLYSEKTKADYLRHGVLARPHASDTVIASSALGEILYVTLNSKHLQRVRAHKLARIAHYDHRYGELMFTVNEEPHPYYGHVFLARRADRLIGFARFDIRDRVWRVSWSDYEAHRFPEPEHTPTWSLSFAWVISAARRSGLAAALVRAGVAHLGIKELGFQTEFSDAGAALAKHLSPERLIIAK